MTSATQTIFEEHFPSDLNLVPEIQNRIKEKIKDYLPAEKLDAVILAVSEAVSNSIKHGNKSDAGKKVEIKIRLSDEKITISVLDEGKGFDLSKIPDPTNPENLLKESGRGIFIIKNVIDNLEYKFTEKGTLTVLTISR